MNKKQAIAYAQVTLNYMLSSKYNKEINAKNLEKEMRQTFKIYGKNIIENIAEAQKFAEKKLNYIKRRGKNARIKRKGYTKTN